MQVWILANIFYIIFNPLCGDCMSLGTRATSTSLLRNNWASDVHHSASLDIVQCFVEACPLQIEPHHVIRGLKII